MFAQVAVRVQVRMVGIPGVRVRMDVLMRLAAMTSTHFLAQVRRLRVDRRQRVDSAERGREP